MQMIGTSNCDLHRCFAHHWGGLLGRNGKIWPEQRTFLLLWHCPFEVFVAFPVQSLFTTKSCHLHR